MADADEDFIPRGPDVGDIDLSDETQDFRFLLNFSYVLIPSETKLLTLLTLPLIG
jgi:hypothetical protein